MHVEGDPLIAPPPKLDPRTQEVRLKRIAAMTDAEGLVLVKSYRATSCTFCYFGWGCLLIAYVILVVAYSLVTQSDVPGVKDKLVVVVTVSGVLMTGGVTFSCLGLCCFEHEHRAEVEDLRRRTGGTPPPSEGA